MSTRAGGLRGLLDSSMGIAIAMAVMNVGAYAFQMVAARILGPQDYGAIASLMNLLLVVAVLQLGLQATAARRIAAEPVHVAQIEQNILRVTYRASLVLGAVLLLATPLINALLRLDSLATAALVAVTAVPLTIMGGQAGILQGERRWFPLAVLYMAVGIPRVLIGTVLILLSPGEFTAMLAVALGLFLPVIVGWLALRRPRAELDAPVALTEGHSARRLLRETGHNSQALLAFFVLSNLDLILARNLLDEHDAGLYAGGLILSKAVLFLPQFVVVTAFPAMSSAAERRRALFRSLIMVAAIGAFCTVCSVLLSDIAMVFVGGADYAEIEPRLWMFAVLGTVLSMLQLLVYSVLARQGTRSVWFVWAAAVAVVVGGLAVVDSVVQLLTLVVVVDVALFAVLLALSIYRVTRGAPTPDAVAV